MKRIISLALCFMLAFTLCQPAFAAGDTITWTGESSDNWNVAGNWNPAQVPGAGDTAVIPASTVAAAVYDTTSVTLDCSGEVSVKSGKTLWLTGTSYLKDGKLSGDGDVTIIVNDSELQWSGGNIEGNGTFTVDANARLNKETDSDVYLSRSLVNNGQIMINAGGLSLYGGMEGTGTFTVSDSAYLYFEQGDYSIGGDFVNSGDVTIWDTSSVSFNAGYKQGSTGTLALKVWGSGSDEYCKLNVVGAAELGGILEIDFIGEYAPQPGDAFEIMTYGSRTGTFSEINSNMEGIALVPAYTGIGLTLTVSDGTAPEENVCEIGENKYTTLGEALDVVKDGETIRLLETINYNSGIVIEDKRITFDLNGFTLNVVNNAEGDSAEEMSGLYVKGNAAVDLVDLSGAGELNVTGAWYGVYAASTDDETDSLTNNNTSVIVTNALGHEYAGVMAFNAKVTVKGNAASDEGGYGVSANYEYAEVLVEGNVTASGDGSVGALANSSTKITVKGSVTVSGYNSRGIEAYDDGEAIVEKDITASGTGSIGIYTMRSNVTAGGNVTGDYGGIYAFRSDVDITGDVRTLGFEVNNYGVSATNFSYINVEGDVRSNEKGAVIWAEDNETPSMIAIGGVIEAPKYVQIGIKTLAFTDGYLDSLMEGYLIYEDPDNPYVGAVYVAEFAGGSGSVGDPYLVAHADQLYNVRNHLDKHFKLIENIDLSGYSTDKGWEPIGDERTPFTGAFDGGGHTISGLFIKRPVDPFIGLFANIGLDAKIRNVDLINVNVTGYNHVGGLAGRNRGQITNSYAIGNLTGEAETGGLVGENSGPISDSYAQGTVTDKYGGRIGGLVGENTASGTITNCYAEVEVTVTSGNTSYGSAGGLVGYNFGGITESYAVGTVVGRYHVGGLVGTSTGTIDKSYATATVTGTSSNDTKVGGLVGNNNGSISNSFARGDVSGNDKVGGLVGYNKSSITSSNEKSSITTSYATGKVNGGSSYIGGLAGYNYDKGDFVGIITDSYWDKETSLLNTSAGGTGKTTAEMKQQATYVDWNFATIWGINDSDNDGYPFLAVPIAPTVPTVPQSLTATPGNGQVAFSWAAPASDGGSAITKYQVSKDNGANWTDAGLSTTYTFTGLTNGTEYSFKVRAVNNIGNGAEASATATPTAAPTQPGQFYTWGGNSRGQLGDGTLQNKSTPTHIGTDDDWAAINAGGSHTVALKSDGSLWAWGWNNKGQLGDGKTENRDDPVRIGSDNDWAAAEAGKDYTVAIKADGSLWAWGNNAIGQLGDGTVENRNVPTLIDGGSTWIAVAAGVNHTIALQADGSLWAWGANSKGQLGDGGTNYKTVPTQISTEKWASVSAGSSYTVALKTDGSLWAWGWNDKGQLGDGTVVEKNVPTRVDTDTWLAVAAGDNHVVAIKSGGSLWAWGGNEYGELGNGSSDGIVDAPAHPVPAQIGTDTDWFYVTAGYGHNAAFKTDGSLWLWGHNGTGQLGNGTSGYNEGFPQRLDVAGTWLAVTCGDAHTVALLEAGLTVPAAPQNFTAVPGDGQVALSWTAPASDGGSAVTKYQVSKDNGVNWTDTGLNTTHTFTGLTNGTAYTFKVRAVNSVGNGAEASATATPTAATYVLTVQNGTGGGSYLAGIPVPITADPPAPGKVFDKWTTSNGGSFGDVNSASTTFTMPSGAVTVTATYKDASVGPYTLTVSGSYAGTSGAGQYAPDAQVSIHAGSRSNYTFAGWTSADGVTFMNANNATTTFTMPDKNVTITANWSYNGNGGGSSTPTTPAAPAAPAYKADVKEGSGAETTIPVTVDKDAETASVDAGSQGLDQGGTIITIPSIPDVDTYLVGIPVPDLSTSDVQGTLTVNTDAGSVTVLSNMLTGVSGISGSKADIAIGQGDKDNLPDAVKAAIGDRPLVQLTLSIDGKRTDWSNPDAPVTVSIPYTPTAAELANLESIVVWYIDGSGNAVSVPNGHYNPATGMVTFDTTHFSDYAVAYNKVSFNDVTVGAWYHKAISFIAARGITGGTGNGNYSPEAKLTRGQFIVMLMKAYDIAPDANPKDNFSDAGGTYYTGYLAAAKRLGISAGIGNNMFAPEKEITRQEMFTLLYNALKIIGQLPQDDSGKTLDHFSDAGQIDSWAKEAMRLMVKTGTIGGNAGKLNPTSTTTRAEMAQVLYNLLSK